MTALMAFRVVIALRRALLGSDTCAASSYARILGVRESLLASCLLLLRGGSRQMSTTTDPRRMSSTRTWRRSAQMESATSCRSCLWKKLLRDSDAATYVSG
jgi:hypothetical protein